jgi:filamentous hemagglutinin
VRAALRQGQRGASVYKGGVLGRSETSASQFLSLENPLNPGYAGRYGIPPENSNFEFILTGRVQPGAPVITRPAPGIPPNPGGGIEAVTSPGSFRIDSFYMPD